MRSRDGNSTFLRSICALIFCFSYLSGDEYIISYRYAVEDATLLNDSLDISKAMTPCRGHHVGSPLYLPLSNDTKDLKKIILSHDDEFFTYINTLSLHVRNFDSLSNGMSSSLTTVTLKPTCFTVEFNDNLVRMAPFKE